MARYAALLRGINLGPRNRLPMADLRALLTELGCDHVRTYLQSGNAVFASPRPAAELETAIEAAIAEATGLTVPCLIRDEDELRAVIDAHPLADVATNGSTMMVLFLSQAPDPALLKAHDPTTLDPDNIRIGDRVIYQWCPNGFHKAPPVAKFVETRLKLTATVRNWNTVTKLANMLADVPAS